MLSHRSAYGDAGTEEELPPTVQDTEINLIKSGELT